MRTEELRELTLNELEQRKADLEDERFNLNMRSSFKALDNPLRLRHIRRDMARILTVIHEDKIGIKALAQSKTSILSDKENSGKDKK